MRWVEQHPPRRHHKLYAKSLATQESRHTGEYISKQIMKEFGEKNSSF